MALQLQSPKCPGLGLGNSTFGEDKNEYHASQDVREVPGSDEPRGRPGFGRICLGRCSDRLWRHRRYENFIQRS